MSAAHCIALNNATGARCPIGLSALPIAMCARAKKAEPRSTRLRDKRDREIGACLTPGLPEDLYGYDRLLALAAPALREVPLGIRVEALSDADEEADEDADEDAKHIDRNGDYNDQNESSLDARGMEAATPELIKEMEPRPAATPGAEAARMENPAAGSRSRRSRRSRRPRRRRS